MKTIILPEYIFDHWLFEDPIKFQWWLDLLRQAADGECTITVKSKSFKCKKGGLVTSHGLLAKRWKTSRDKAQAFLRKLEANGEIKRSSDANLTQITICNIGDYAQRKRSSDANLTQSTNTDAELTQTTTEESAVCVKSKRSSDAQSKRKNKEKEKLPPTPPIKEKINKKENAPTGEVSKLKISSLHARAREAFENYYFDVYGQAYYFDKKDAGQLKHLLNKIRFSRTNRANPLPVDDDSMLDAFVQFIKAINKQWIANNFSITQISSHYNEIISEIKNSRNHGPAQQPGTRRDIDAENAASIQRQKSNILSLVDQAEEKWRREVGRSSDPAELLLAQGNPDSVQSGPPS